MSKYISSREKIKDFIENVIMEKIILQDLDYKETVKYIMVKEGVSKKVVEELLNLYIENKRIKEIRVLTISDEKIPDFLEMVAVKETENMEIDKGVKEVLENVKPEGR